MTPIKENIKLFTHSGCLSAEALLLYAHGEAGNDMKKKINDHISVCKLCNEAIEGYKLVRNKNLATRSVTRIEKRIDKHVIASKRKGPRQLIGSKRAIPVSYWAAASVLLVLGFFGYFNVKKSEIANKDRLYPRLLGENAIKENTVNYFTILGENIENEDIDDVIESSHENETDKNNIENTLAENQLAANSKINKTENNEGNFIIKNDMVIRESKIPELLTPINYPFDVFVQKKIDSLLESSGIKYNITAEFVISRDGKMKQPRVIESSHTELDAFTVKVLQESLDWKPATINDTPVDYPVKIKIRKD